MVLVVCQREVQRVREEGVREGDSRENGGGIGWMNGEEKKTHVEIVAVTHFCKNKKKSKEKSKEKGKQKEIKSIAVTINQLLNNNFEATFKLFCISSLGKCSNGQL